MHHLHGHQQRRRHQQPLLTAHRHQLPRRHPAQPGAPVPVVALPPDHPAGPGVLPDREGERLDDNLAASTHPGATHVLAHRVAFVLLRAGGQRPCRPRVSSFPLPGRFHISTLPTVHCWLPVPLPGAHRNTESTVRTRRGGAITRRCPLEVGSSRARRPPWHARTCYRSCRPAPIQVGRRWVIEAPPSSVASWSACLDLLPLGPPAPPPPVTYWGRALFEPCGIPARQATIRSTSGNATPKASALVWAIASACGKCSRWVTWNTR